jgi:hypothetical protein
MTLASWLLGSVVALVLALLGAPATAQAEYQIGSVYFTATGSAEIWGRSLSDMLDTDLVRVSQGGKFANCGVVIVELKHRADVVNEIELQKSPAFDPTSRVKSGQLLDAAYVIEGSVQPDGADGISWVIQMREVAGGRIVARDNAGVKLDRVLDEPQHIAERLLGQICGKSYRIAGNAGPMQVTGTACSLVKPFTVKGAGGGMEITFSYTPADAAHGTVSYTGGGTGSLAMVRMAGKGTYSVTTDDKGGTLKQTHSGAVTNPGGGSATHTDTLKLTPAGPC